jgi:hypothetical protein
MYVREVGEREGEKHPVFCLLLLVFCCCWFFSLVYLAYCVWLGSHTRFVDEQHNPEHNDDCVACDFLFSL